ncbi:MAG: ClpXP protease specificity-enhancing factor SspB, partial [Lysobacterales bacterium]
EVLSFNARFSGRRYEVKMPIEAVLAIYAKENGQGMKFWQEDDKPPPTGPGTGPEDGDNRRSHLKLVK